jgi:hypothetical protein
MFTYFTREEADLFTFYRIPKEMFTNPVYKKMSSDAKILYGLLLDRNGLSKLNDWFDSEGRVFIYFSREEAMELLDIARPKATSLFKELRDSELIHEVRQGLGRTNIIYVGKFIVSKKSYKHASNELNSIDVRKPYFRKEDKITSGENGKLLQDVMKSSPNNTELNETYLMRSKEHTHSDCQEIPEQQMVDNGVCVGIKTDSPLPVTGEKIKEVVPQLKAMVAQKEKGQGDKGIGSLDILKPLQDRIKEVTGSTIQISMVKELIGCSSPERINYHLDNWDIHKLYQRYEGAGWFISVIRNDIQPMKKTEFAPYGQKVSQLDNFTQREYTDEEYEGFYFDLENYQEGMLSAGRRV